jgi:hypothetical protein
LGFRGDLGGGGGVGRGGVGDEGGEVQTGCVCSGNETLKEGSVGARI